MRIVALAAGSPVQPYGTPRGPGRALIGTLTGTAGIGYAQRLQADGPVMRRCPLCAGMNHTALFGRLLRCTLCALAFGGGGAAMPSLETYRCGDDGRCRFPNWNNWLSRATDGLLGARGGAVQFAPQTVRMFATRSGQHATELRTSVPFASTFAAWRYGRTIQARIAARPDPAPGGPDRRLTLGVIAARRAWPDVLAVCGDMAGHAAAMVVVLDSADAAEAGRLERALRDTLAEHGGPRARVIAQPLGGDFARQRNRVQAEARTDWVLQLDCDERLAPSAKHDLPGLIDDAEREGWDAVAFTRHNLVDGVVSALYPDVQYRLLRRGVRFTRAVHEYPLLGARQTSFVNLGAGIIHTLTTDRLPRRETLYEAIDGGGARRHDTALLRMPLEPGIALPA